jgi:hypothetical protein
VSSTQLLVASGPAIAAVSRASVAVSGACVVEDVLAVTVRGAGTLVQLVGMTGSGGMQVLSVSWEGSQLPSTLPPPGPTVLEPVPLDDPLLPAEPVPLDDPLLPLDLVPL